MVRKGILPKDVTEVLLRSRRRCAICFGLNRDTQVKRGQIAHIDHDNTNSHSENLVFLCLFHHDEYDSKTSQSKGLTESEVKSFRDELLGFVASEQKLAWPDYQDVEGISKVSGRPLLPPEVYDRKIEIYRVVKGFLDAVTSEATVSIDQLRRFAMETDEALFLFDKDIANYLRVMYAKAVRLHFNHEALDGFHLSLNETRESLSEQNADLLNWFSDQYESAREILFNHIALG